MPEECAAHQVNQQGLMASWVLNLYSFIESQIKLFYFFTMFTMSSPLTGKMG